MRLCSRSASFIDNDSVQHAANAHLVTAANPLEVASGYLVSTEDRMIPPDAQRAMAKRAGSTVVEAKGSHAIYMSQPQAVASLIETAAKDAPLAAAR